MKMQSLWWIAFGIMVTACGRRLPSVASPEGVSNDVSTVAQVVPRRPPPAATTHFRGVVRFRSGAPASNAMVWMQVAPHWTYHYGGEMQVTPHWPPPYGGEMQVTPHWPPPYGGEMQVTPHWPPPYGGEMIVVTDGVMTAVTDSSGAFELASHLAPTALVFIAQVDGYLPTFSRVYEAARLATNPFVRVTINDHGSRLVGEISTLAGMPLTNVTATYMRWSDDTRTPRAGALPLAIDPDGGFLSALLTSAEYSFAFYARGYVPIERKFLVCPDELPLLELVFDPASTLTGVVCDAFSGEPLPDVRICHASTSQSTDSNGCFQVCLDDVGASAEYRFEKAGYVPVTCRLRRYEADRPHRIRLSAAAHVEARIISDGDYVPSEYVVRLEHLQPRCATDAEIVWPDDDISTRRFDTWVDPAVAVLSNLPSHCSPVCVTLEDSGLVLSRSAAVPLQPGETTRVTLAVPPCGRLRLRCPVVSGWKKVNARSFLSNGTDLCWDLYGNPDVWDVCTLPAGVWTFDITADICRSMSTNIEIFANTVTELTLALDSNVAGTIHGMVVASREMGVNAGIAALSSSGTVVSTTSVDGVATTEFKLTRLAVGERYDVRVIPDSLATSIIVRAVVPDGPPLTITLPAAFVISGEVVTADGVPVKGEAGIAQINMAEFQHTFRIAPVYPGTHILGVRVEGHVLHTQPVDVVDADVDVGRIIIYQHGLTLRGRLVDVRGDPLSRIKLEFMEMPRSRSNMRALAPLSVCEATSGYDGIFEAHNIPSNCELVMTADRPDGYCQLLSPLYHDTDLGVIIIAGTYVVIDARTADGRPASGLLIPNEGDNAATDDTGRWEGSLAIGGNLIILASPCITNDLLIGDISPTRLHFARYTPILGATNYVEVVLPHGFQLE